MDLAEEHADVIQIGARNMQNFSLLRRAGRSKLPVLLKRGMAAMLDEWLLAAEYIMAEGNYAVVLCERGVRTFAQHTRNTLDLASIPAVRHISHLPRDCRSLPWHRQKLYGDAARLRRSRGGRRRTHRGSA